MSFARIADTDYDAFMRCDARPGWTRDVERSLASWLSSKFPLWKVDVSTSGAWESAREGLGGRNDDRERVRLQVTRCEDFGQGRVLQAQLTETIVRGQVWQTELLSLDGETESWLRLRTLNSVGSFVMVPRLAKALLHELPFSDGHMQFAPQAQLHQLRDVDDVVSALTDPQRHGLMFVAATEAGARSITGFTASISRASAQVYGLAQVVVLGPEATAAFNARVGRSHAALPWSIRSYRPHVRVGDDTDGRRHRFLLPRSLQRPNVGRMLGAIARGQASSRTLPPSVDDVLSHLERHAVSEGHTAVPSGQPASPVTPDLPSVAVRKRAAAHRLPMAPGQGEPHLRAERDGKTPSPVEPGPVTDAPLSEHPATAVVLPTAEERAIGLIRQLLHIDTITEDSLIAAVDALERDATSELERRLTEQQQLSEQHAKAAEEHRLALVEMEEALEDEQLARADAEERQGRVHRECVALRSTVTKLQDRLYREGDQDA